MWSKYVSSNVCRDFRRPLSTFAMVERKSFNGKFKSKNYFSDWAFYVTIIDADITLEGESLSIQYLI